ncbi:MULTISPECIES: cation diffusion facilitator family transporter [Halomonadaceae]|uniref:cation diffusion facilitator family transporter n=1 Tax=Halomonadaceae TaxID=28256 RepID=UPI001597CB7E|nr:MULTISPECIES: cation diffusion facilitator family transporter [Halomonas]QJQ94115.1 cation diffusion facilitator family transporter [Halomonas sp. PA5]
MRSEVAALRLSAFMALLVGIVATAVALLANSQAILLDGMFNLVYFGIALVTLRVSRLASYPDSDRYPFGYTYFESLVNAGKGVMILGVSFYALFEASIALMTGGSEIAAGLAIGYALFATLCCAITAWSLSRTLRHVDSPLVRADQENWVVNSLISAAVLLAFCLIPLLERFQQPLLIPYIDSLLVIVVVLLCLGVPVRMASRAILELLNRAPPESLATPVRAAIIEELKELPTRQVRVRMVRPGRMLYVVVHVVLPEEFPLHSLRELDALRERIDSAVRNIYSPLIVDTLFTADAHWAMPSSGLLVRSE